MGELIFYVLNIQCFSEGQVIFLFSGINPRTELPSSPHGYQLGGGTPEGSNIVSAPPRDSLSISVPELVTGTSSSPHTRPDWLKDLKKDFRTVVIEKCSLKAREAVENDVKIEDTKKLKDVRNEIINETVSCLLNIFGDVGRPVVGQVREIVAEMGFHYPAMFKDDDIGYGYGLGGCKGITGLANQMLDRFRNRQSKRKAPNPVGESEPVKKGKKKIIYGCINFGT